LGDNCITSLHLQILLQKIHDDVEKLFARIFDAKIEGFPRPAGKYSYGLTDTYSRDGHLIIDVKYQTAHL